MQFKTVPYVNPRYWAAMVLASVFGANTGDFVSHNLHLGHVRGLPYLAGVFVVIVLAERLVSARWEGWYWLAVVTLRTAATNLADLSAHDSKLGAYNVAIGFLVALAAVLLGRRALAPESDTSGVPRTDFGYWLAMLIAGTLGTALGDGLAHDLSLPVATVSTGVAVLVALGLRLRPALAIAVTYWLAIVTIRTFGTNFGDLLADTLGLSTSTPLSGVALLALLLLWRPKPSLTLSAA